MRNKKNLLVAIKNTLALNNINSLARVLIHRQSTSVKVEPIFKRIVGKALSLTNGWGEKFSFVFLPVYSRYLSHDTDHEAYRNKSKVLNMFRELSVNVVGIHESVFKLQKQPLSLFPLKVQGHYTPETNKLIAQQLILLTDCSMSN